MTFIYVAKQGPRKTVDGRLEAGSQEEAVAKLSAMGLVPLELRSVAQDGGALSRSRRRDISDLERVLLTRKLSDLLDSGLPLLQVLRTIQRQEQKGWLGEVIGQVFERVRDGAALSAAMAGFDQVFPRAYVNMVRAGELSGSLNVVMARLADFLEADQETRSQVRGSLVYPAVILLAAVVSITVIFLFVIPGVVGVLEDLDQELPLATRLLIGVSDGFRNFWWVGVLLGAGMTLYFQRLRSSEQGRLWFDRWILRVPLVGEYILVAETARFARSLATLLESGVTIVRALEAAAQLSDNSFLRAEVLAVSQQVANGDSLAKSMAAHPVFSEMIVGMVSVGEESGRVPHGLNKLAGYYERQTRRVMKQLTSIIEPALILFMGLLVAFILMGTLLPIFRMNLMVQ